MGARRDLTGMEFGKLKVIDSAGKNDAGNYLWNCICECGNTKVFQCSELTTGRVVSCGCGRGSKHNDITDKRFGKLVAKKIVGRGKSGGVRWECICDCWNVVNVTYQNLASGHTKSCGCLKLAEDLTGRVFGRLTVIERAGLDARGNIIWNCECTCGKIATVTSGNLRHNRTKSCGCLKNKRGT